MKILIKIFIVIDVLLISIALLLIYSEPNLINGTTKNDLTLHDEKKLIFIGDSGMGNEMQYSVAEAINHYCSQGCNMGFIAGDVIYPDGVGSIDDDDFQLKFEDPYNILSFPMYIAYGNHDYLGCVECYIDYSLISDKFKMPNRYYTVPVSSDLEVFVIDTENFDDEQKDWLEYELMESESKYKIVVGHRPIITYETNYIDSAWGVDNGASDIISRYADIYVAGHSHLLEYNRVEESELRQIVSGGGGAVTRTIADRSGPIFYYEGNGFVAMIVNDKGLLIEYIDENGNILASFKK